MGRCLPSGTFISVHPRFHCVQEEVQTLENYSGFYSEQQQLLPPELGASAIGSRFLGTAWLIAAQDAIAALSVRSLETEAKGS